MKSLASLPLLLAAVLTASPPALLGGAATIVSAESLADTPARQANSSPHNDETASPTAAKDCAAGDDYDPVTRKREAALRMVEAYMASKATASKSVEELKMVVDDAKLLFNTTLDPETIDEILMEATRRAEAASNMENGNRNKNGDVIRDGYPDRFIRGMERTIQDPDCMEREFDLSDGTFDAGEGAEVLRKCKLLVLRNAFRKEFLEEYRESFAEYIHGLHTGRISSSGHTSNGENFFLHLIDHKRWEVILPPSMAKGELLANPGVMDVLTDKRILGSRLVLHSLGTAIAESGADAQRWHRDDSYLFGDESVKVAGLGGHDLPSYAVTMMVPLLNMTHEHGPTEFCMGTSNLDGADGNLKDRVKDATLVDNQSVYMQQRMHNWKSSCPPKFWRSPQLKFGDLLLFDYQIEHRGGPNSSPDMRSIMYMTYSRYWYKDANFKKFDDDDDDEEDEEEEVVDDEEEEDSDADITAALKEARGDTAQDSDATQDETNDEDEEDEEYEEYEEYEEEETPTPAEKKQMKRQNLRLLRQLVHSARFAYPSEVQPCDENCQNARKEFKLESVKDFLHGGNGYEDAERERQAEEEAFNEMDMEDRDPVSFLLSNADLDVPNLSVYVGEKRMGVIRKGESREINTHAGEKMEVRSPDGFVYKTWRILTDQTQLVVSKNTVNVMET